jgi:hypothetical protein
MTGVQYTAETNSGTNTLPIGEVIAAATTYFVAQCIEVPRPDRVAELPDPPPFGAFVRVGGGARVSDATPLPEDFDPFETPPAPALTEDEDAPRALYAVVFHAETGALEAGRPLTAFGLDEDALRREQPHLYELLATRFSAALVAHEGPEGKVRPYLPPRPPRPHARVFPVTQEETRRLTERLDYLRPLLAASGGLSYPPDELVAALLRRAWRAWHGDEDFLLRAGRELGLLLPNDYDRLRALVARIVG